jgi:hypothetical protein
MRGYSLVLRILIIAALFLAGACDRPAQTSGASGKSGPAEKADRSAAPSVGTTELGEDVLPPDKAPNDAPLRPIKGHPFTI